MRPGLAATLAEDRRGIILRVLADQGDYALNEGVLQDALDRYGHRVGRDMVRDDMMWLADHGLVTIEEVAKLKIASLTQRGSDVATGRARCEGVKRPEPRE